MDVYLNIAQIILGIALIGIILLQTRSGGLGSVFGGAETSIYRTRRGVERTLFILTIILSLLFFIIAIINAVVTGTPG
ncbi:MAG TPA: preprotein translocase subunit SecG [Chloroflexi bacterium]|nr:preprotein translocase subunit SecG [Chloroflexota bacterium]